jgi:hypothetical protein
MRNERSNFGGWEPVSGRPGEFRGKMVTGPVTPEFAKFSEESRARWDVVEWLKLKFKRLLNKESPDKKSG